MEVGGGKNFSYIFPYVRAGDAVDRRLDTVAVAVIDVAGGFAAGDLRQAILCITNERDIHAPCSSDNWKCP